MRAMPLMLTLALVGCPGGETDTEDTEVTNAELEAIEVTPSSLTLSIDQEELLTVTARFDDGTTQDVASAAEYRVVNGSVATVSSTGRVSALSEGTTDIEVSYQGTDDTVRLTVVTSSLGGEVQYLGHPVAAIEVSLAGDHTDSTTTDVNGRFAFSGLANGDYRVETNFEAAPRDHDDLQTASVNNGAVDDVDLAVISGGYPTAPDAWEPDNVPGSANTLTEGVFQHHTLYTSDDPADGGDIDFFRLTLTAGTEYEILTSGLCPTCDTTIQVWNSSASEELDSNDDHNGLNSRVEFTPESDGTYLVTVEAFEDGHGVADYFIGYAPFVDEDEDGEGLLDCDDDDDDRYYSNTEEAGDGIDQDCTGNDTPATDPDEPNDTRANAITAVITSGSHTEGVLDLQARESNTRIVGDGDFDLFAVTVPANSAVWADTSNMANVDFLDTDGTTARDDLRNETNSAVTYYVKLRSSSSAEARTLDVYSLGTDLDRDDFYSRDWDVDRDCDDGYGTVNPESSSACDGGS